MTDKCREAFEKDMIDLHGEQVRHLLEKDESGKYITELVNVWLTDWTRAWNASHDRCVELCGTIGRAGQYQDAIQNDKVEL